MLVQFGNNWIQKNSCDSQIGQHVVLLHILTGFSLTATFI